MLFFQRKNNTFPSKQYSVILIFFYKKIVIPIGRIPKKKNSNPAIVFEYLNSRIPKKKIE